MSLFPLSQIQDSLRRSPIRYSWVFSTFILSYCFMSDAERAVIFNNITFAFPPEIGGFTPSALVKPLMAFISTGFIHLLIYQHISDRVDLKTATSVEEIKVLTELLEFKSGIKRIYPGKRNSPAINQAYASDIMKSLDKTRSLQVLCIAGYEYVGKGEGKSLFYDAIKERAWINADIVTISPSSSDIINDRIKQIQRADNTYNTDKMKKEIAATEEKTKLLQISRHGSGSLGKVCLFHTRNHPIFRLVIMDDCLFMGTYEIDHHGHESPVYRINKVVEGGNRGEERSLSLYDSFSRYFNSIKASADVIIA